MTAALPAAAFDVEEIVAGLSAWVEIESPTTDAAGVERMLDAAAAAMGELGAACERHPGRDGFGGALAARLPGRREEPGILILAHLDTVHPTGTLAGGLPLRRDGDRLYGPGVYDMKGGAYLAWEALRQVRARDGATPLPVTCLFTGDEEFGSPTTRALIEAEAQRHRYVLVPEPAQDRGNLITGRWAFQRFRLRTSGRPAHAGATLASGRSAIREMAEQVVRVEALSDPARDVTLSVGVIHAGAFVNVVPAECSAEVLAVAPTHAALEEVCTRMAALQPTTPAVGLEVEAGPQRPLFEPGEGTMALYRRALAIAEEIGFRPGHGSVGGGSDGNFTGALGIATLDGLGACGDGFHTLEEHVLVSSLVPRARLLSGLLRTLA